MQKKNNPLKVALEKCKTAFIIVFWFAFTINLLLLVTPLYSLQVLDRVIGSGNRYTLLMLSIIIAAIYFISSLLQVARSFTLIKVGEWLDNTLSPTILGHSISAATITKGSSSSQLLRDFQTVKTFLTSIGINTLFDAPWSIIYIIIVFKIHPYIGYFTLVGAIIIIFFALFNAVATNKTLYEATEFSIKSMVQADVANRNSEAVEAMGMIKNITKNWAKINTQVLKKQSLASYRNGVISNFSRFIRNLIQMGVTGIGAYVVVSTNYQDMTTGGMIASSIIVGRALAPFDNSIVMWKTISGALKSYKNVNESFSKYSLREQAMPIPGVRGVLSVENIYYAKPSSVIGGVPNYILKGVSFNAQPGDIIAIIGHSAAGKSTLAKLIVGVWEVFSGSIKLDGGDVYKWNREDFGKKIGYLPQGIELFSGTVKDNIARMDEEADPVDIIEAAKTAGAHEFILGLTDGYDTDIGINGVLLSGGQKQRIALARAFYKKPKLLVLDEPNANLDEKGEEALANALRISKKNNITVIVISHRPSILSEVDKIIVLSGGTIVKLGTKEEIKSININAVNTGFLALNNK